ncbi:hypothetical protein [Sulfuriroseicoccus oceanibius]|uniref:Uncharacterized protein n=1 Tax=Sulfuriroseicoccus oceanibius TaxID=2707525 RepID=A0A6B3L223_9BACT|nr:hypothetical protein [Sulfuriroseicoccus oceanibius]QQL44226.1 hypothetical protein G3M56_010005 [Sulfuriroseicoccus oceanibius]
MQHNIWILAILLLPYLASAEIEVADTKGRKMNVEVLSYTEGNSSTRIQRTADGAIFDVKLSLFDAESQAKIKQSAPKVRADLNASVSVGRRRERIGSSSYMKRQTLTATVKVVNKSMKINFLDGTGTLLLVARQTKRYADDDADYGKILSIQTFTPIIHSGGTFEWDAKPVETKYDSDKDRSNIGGWEYYGWVLVIQDTDDTVVAVETNIGNLQKETRADPSIGKIFAELEEDELVKKNLSKLYD